jgi:hypothetical protein
MMRKNELDEMQIQKRNSIGYQSFMLLTWLILLDVVLDGLGVKWLAYPTNIFLITLVCNSIYLIRVMWHKSIAGPKSQGKHFALNIILIGGISVLVAALLIFLFTQNGLNETDFTGDNGLGAIILFSCSIAALIAIVLINIISKRRDAE